jgi:hypothetical protein
MTRRIARRPNTIVGHKYHINCRAERCQMLACCGPVLRATKPFAGCYLARCDPRLLQVTVGANLSGAADLRHEKPWRDLPDVEFGWVLSLDYPRFGYFRDISFSILAWPEKRRRHGEVFASAC